jgi:hypothetical protein
MKEMHWRVTVASRKLAEVVAVSPSKRPSVPSLRVSLQRATFSAQCRLRRAADRCPALTPHPQLLRMSICSPPASLVLLAKVRMVCALFALIGAVVSFMEDSELRFESNSIVPTAGTLRRLFNWYTYFRLE